MKARNSDRTQVAINTIFNPPASGGRRCKLPVDYYQDMAPLTVDQWHRKMDEHVADRGQFHLQKGMPQSLLELTKHIVALPIQDKAACIDRVLAEARYMNRINIDQILRTAHQILQLPPASQIKPIRELKILASYTLTRLSFSKVTGETLIRALGLDQPGPWADEIKKRGIIWRDEVVEPDTGIAHPPPQKSSVDRPIKRRADSRNQAGVEVPLDYAPSAKRVRTEIAHRDASFEIDQPITPSENDLAMDEDALDSLLADLDAGAMAEWTRNFQTYRCSPGSYAEQSAALSTLLKDIEQLNSVDKRQCIEKIFEQMNDGLTVQFAHAKHFWLELDSCRKANPEMDIAPEYDRAVWQWARRSGWTADELVEVNPLVNSAHAGVPIFD